MIRDTGGREAKRSRTERICCSLSVWHRERVSFDSLGLKVDANPWEKVDDFFHETESKGKYKRISSTRLLSEQLQVFAKRIKRILKNRELSECR